MALPKLVPDRPPALLPDAVASSVEQSTLLASPIKRMADSAIEARVKALLGSVDATLVPISTVPPAHLRIRREFLLALRVGTAMDVVKFIHNPKVAGVEVPDEVGSTHRAVARHAMRILDRLFETFFNSTVVIPFISWRSVELPRFSGCC